MMNSFHLTWCTDLLYSSPYRQGDWLTNHKKIYKKTHWPNLWPSLLTLHLWPPETLHTPKIDPAGIDIWPFDPVTPPVNNQLTRETSWFWRRYILSLWPLTQTTTMCSSFHWRIKRTNRNRDLYMWQLLEDDADFNGWQSGMKRRAVGTRVELDTTWKMELWKAGQNWLEGRQATEGRGCFLTLDTFYHYNPRRCRLQTFRKTTSVPGHGDNHPIDNRNVFYFNNLWPLTWPSTRLRQFYKAGDVTTTGRHFDLSMG